MLVNICKIATVLGNFLTMVGCLGLLLGVFGVFNLDFFAFGLSAGIRVVGSVAIAGCLLSAIGYGTREFLNQ
jgi:hypothetical protein